MARADPSLQACFANSTEVLFAAMTFYHLRVIERLWGSRKFAVSCCNAPVSLCTSLAGVCSPTLLRLAS